MLGLTAAPEMVIALPRVMVAATESFTARPVFTQAFGVPVPAVAAWASPTGWASGCDGGGI
jgi:hypothetical protein